jgi:hypothetical protein
MDRIKGKTDRVIHDVERNSNLDLILRGTNGAVNKLASAIFNGLELVAVALSTPTDNSEEIKKQILRIRESREQLEDTVQANEPK